jgi:hypothetical protein
MDCDLCVPTGFDDKELIACKWQPVGGSRMQIVLARHERNLEAALLIRLELRDLYAVPAGDS